ncbi:MAG: carbohydrate ABC transporter permease [Eubacteriales bacterium]
MKASKIQDKLIFIGLALATIVTLSPLILAFINSLKTMGEMYTSVTAWPVEPKFDNYTVAFERMDFINALCNTTIITSCSVAGIIVITSLAGYKICRTKTKFASFMYYFFIFSMLIPFSAVMVTIAKEISWMGLTGTKFGIIITYMGFGCSQAIFLYHGFVKGIPIDMEEAARIDGCNEFKMFYTIIFPCLKPITATIAILNVLWIWNDFLLPLILLSKQANYTLVLSTNKFFGAYISDWPNIMAGLLMSVIPIVIFYIVFQKHIMSGIVSGAVKG